MAGSSTEVQQYRISRVATLPATKLPNHIYFVKANAASNVEIWVTDNAATPTAVAVATGATGPGVPNGGTYRQVLRKVSSTDQDTEWGDGLIPVNFLEDSGRFGGNTANSVVSVNWVAPAYINGYNGTTIAADDQFHHDNSNNGGANTAISSDIDELIRLTRDKVGVPSPDVNLRYGPEWFAMLITQGAGTVAGFSHNGDTFYLSTVNLVSPWPPKATVGFWLKVVAGKAIPSFAFAAGGFNRLTKDGVDQTGVGVTGMIVEPSDSWTYCEGVIKAGSLGYNNTVIGTRMTLGGSCKLALPKLVSGDYDFYSPDVVEILGNPEIYGDF